MQKDIHRLIKDISVEKDINIFVVEKVVDDFWKGIKTVMKNAKKGEVDTFKRINIYNYFYFKPIPKTIKELDYYKNLRMRRNKKVITETTETQK